jgi:hypothetical protein
MTPSRRILLACGAALALVPAASALAADPPAGRVEVRNEAGAPVGAAIGGPDALSTALERIHSSSLARTDDSRPWSIVVGAGTYGDVVIDEPNLTIQPSAAAAVVISTSVGTDHTGGECVDVRRGNVTLQGLVCRTPKDRGVDVELPQAEGGVVLRGLGIDRPKTDGISVRSGTSVLIQDTVVSGAGRDGIVLAKLTGTGPYAIVGGRVARNGDDGIDLADDAQHVRISGVTLDRNKGNGVESDDAGSVDLVLDASTLSRNGVDGVLLGGGGTGLAVTNSVVTANGRFGIDLGRASGLRIVGDKLDGTNKSGDLAFSGDPRSGGTYGSLAFLDTSLDLPGEPLGVILRATSQAERLRLSALPTGINAFNRYVDVRDAGKAPGSVVTLRFGLSPAELAGARLSALAVYEDDRPGNGRKWQAIPGTRMATPGQIDLTLTDGVIASGSDSRFATYGPLAPPNTAPVIAAVYPAPNTRVVGRQLLVAARVGDDDPLGPGGFALTIDGRRRGGVSYRSGSVVFRVPRLSLGLHEARLLVVDDSGLRTAQSWTFSVANRRPTVTRRRALPRPGAFVLSHRWVRIRVPVRDDQPLVRRLVRLRVDGRLVSGRLVRGRLVARLPLRAGRHRITVSVRDRDGAIGARGWAFRVVRP